MTAKRIAAFLAGAVLAVVLAEVAVNYLSPSRLKREVEDGVADLRASDPDVLVISSSHGRSFHVLGEEIARRTGSAVRVVSFAVEAGKLRPMEWVLSHRAAPLLDERNADSQPKRTRLKELMLGVTWWDTCRRGAVPELEHNIVSRAWTWNDYLRDVAANGVTDLNRNFVRYRVQRVQRFSRLAQVQGIDSLQRLADRAIAALGRRLPAAQASSSSAAVPAAVPPELARWREDIETGESCLLSPSELEALERLESFARERGLAFTVVLFPLMPKTVTERGRRTLERFAALMRTRGQERGYRVVDMTSPPMLADEDFMDDMDHLSPAGNAKLVEWALAGELGYLVRSGKAPAP